MSVAKYASSSMAHKLDLSQKYCEHFQRSVWLQSVSRRCIIPTAEGTFCGGSRTTQIIRKSPTL